MKKGDKMVSNLKKVIDALTRCVADETVCYNGCPYFGEADCMNSAIKDTLMLLKEQEPRVLTLKEIQNDCPDYVYLETVSGEIECCIKDKSMSNKFVGYFVCGFGECFIENWNEYWKTWRCWSARPTNEQQEAVQWEWL
jgi:hypothetical protein